MKHKYKKRRFQVGANNSGTMDCNVWNAFFEKEVIPALSALKVRAFYLYVFVQYSCCALQIFFDGHYSHANNKEFLHLIENCGKDVFPVKLPSGLTDLLQPLDVGLFGPLKKTLE